MSSYSSLYGSPYSSSISSTQTKALGGLDPAFAFCLFILLLVIALVIVMIIAWWKLFTKAGKPGWAALIPVYNLWVLFEIVGLPGWLSLLMFVPFVGQIGVAILNIVAAVKMPERFGKEPVYAVGLIFLPMVFYPMLAFGKSEYVPLEVAAEKAE